MARRKMKRTRRNIATRNHVDEVVTAWKAVFPNGITPTQFDLARQIVGSVISGAAMMTTGAIPAISTRKSRRASWGTKSEPTASATSEKTTEAPKGFLPLKAAAKRLNLDLEALRYNVRTNLVSSVKVGKFLYVNPSEIQSFIDKHPETGATA